jgi:hypothetical protein
LVLSSRKFKLARRKSNLLFKSIFQFCLITFHFNRLTVSTGRHFTPFTLAIRPGLPIRMTQQANANQSLHFSVFYINLFCVDLSVRLERRIGSSQGLSTSKLQTTRQKLTVRQLLKEFLALSGTQSFTAVFKTACHLSLSLAELIHSTSSHPIYFKTHFNIIINTYQVLPSGVPTKISYEFFFPSSCSSPRRRHSKWKATQGTRQRRQIPTL